MLRNLILINNSLVFVNMLSLEAFFIENFLYVVVINLCIAYLANSAISITTSENLSQVYRIVRYLYSYLKLTTDAAVSLQYYYFIKRFTTTMFNILKKNTLLVCSCYWCKDLKHNKKNWPCRTRTSICNQTKTMISQLRFFVNIRLTWRKATMLSIVEHAHLCNASLTPALQRPKL